jgi:ribosomal 50S subunit-recycling heat shock protein
MRIDLVLSRLCLFKTRSQAGRACETGTVRLNARPAKASAAVRPGDRIVIIEPTGRAEREYEILALPPEGSISRAAARDLYRLLDRRPLADPWSSDSGSDPARS